MISLVGLVTLVTLVRWVSWASSVSLVCYFVTLLPCYCVSYFVYLFVWLLFTWLVFTWFICLFVFLSVWWWFYFVFLEAYMIRRDMTGLWPTCGVNIALTLLDLFEMLIDRKTLGQWNLSIYCTHSMGTNRAVGTMNSCVELIDSHPPHSRL